MYTPKQFREDRPAVLAAAIREIQMASLVTSGVAGYHASHVPMVLKDEDGVLALETHVARPNGHWTILQRPQASLAIFQGPQAYISPSWYASKREHGKVVPTWNYIAVHAHGMLEVVEDEAWLLAHLGDLTVANEAGREHPWLLSDAPDGFIENLARAVVGLRLHVERLEGSWKLAQHRPEGDRLGAIEGLAAAGTAGAAAVADIMRGIEAERATR